MSLIAELKILADKIKEYSDQDLHEAHTKMVCVEPFMKSLGFEQTLKDMYKEFPADIRGGSKTVDYAIKKDDSPIMIFECKPLGENLDPHTGQLRDYFAAVAPQTRFAILTNGHLYRFYTDLDAPNRMDDEPFLEIDLFDIKPHLVAELERFTKPRFDLHEALAAARNLKDSKRIQQFLIEQVESPTEDLVRCVASAVNIPIDTQEQSQRITTIVQQTLKQLMGRNTDPQPPLPPPHSEAAPAIQLAENQTQTWTGKKISAFTFEGKTYEAKNWKDFYVKFFEILSEDNTIQFDEILEREPRYFKRNCNDFSENLKPSDCKKIGETNIYLKAHLSNEAKREIINAIAQHFGRGMPVPHTPPAR